MMKLTEAEKLHLTHYYWERHRLRQGPADEWNDKNTISENDMFTLTRIWVRQLKTFRIREPKKPWAPPAKSGSTFKQRIRSLKDSLEKRVPGGVRSDLEIRAKMYEVEGRLRRKCLRGSIFNWVVQVVHLDGTTLIYRNACARTWNGLLFVWTEHCGPHYFFLEDLYCFWMFEGVKVSLAR